MLFSVIIPTYNRKREILKCLKSIYNQDFPSDKFEIIVVDDASTDGTHKLLLKEDVTILRLKERSGPSVARNFGASKARGKYLAFTDSDCLVPKNWLLSFSDVFRRYPDLFSAGGSYVNLGKSIYCRYESYVYKRYVREEKEYISKERNELPFALGNIAYRKDAFWELGGFNERIPYYCSGEDALLKEKGFYTFLFQFFTITNLLLNLFSGSQCIGDAVFFYTQSLKEECKVNGKLQ